MKCIIKAMNETKYKPRARWWGYVDNGVRYLCRYHHVLCIFKDKNNINGYWETKTDKIGVLFAIDYYKQNL